MSSDDTNPGGVDRSGIPLDEFDFDETAFAQGRLPGRTYASRSFPLKRTNSADDGTPARFVYKVFDPDGETEITLNGEEWVVAETPAGRYQVKLLVARESGNVKELWIQRIPAAGEGAATNRVNLKQPEAGRLIELLRNLDSIPVEGETRVRVDDELLRDIFSNPDSVAALYGAERERFRQLIASDEAAKDVIALEGRRAAVKRFRSLMDDDEFFDAEVWSAGGGSAERVWQLLFEEHPWLVGATLASQVMTGWDGEKLEQVVSGSSVGGAGKRADALLRTSGRVSSMVFTEIKTHRTDLLTSAEYRSGCWAPSKELAGGVAQVQGTVHRAVAEIGERIASQAGDGSEIPGDFTYLIRPRSILVIGSLSQLTGENGGDHVDKVRSFELFRRQLVEPDVVTFDELLARAEWVVELAAEES